MQPLYSVDHETRQNSNRAEDRHERISEETPLIRFPDTGARERSHTTTLVVSLLLIILISGVIIGIYLLVLQSESENILPPIAEPLQRFGRSESKRQPVLQSTSEEFKVKYVIAVQTDTRQCWSEASCNKLLQDKQLETDNSTLPYNFMVSSQGLTFTGLGWHRPSPMFPQYSTSALVLAFIGNYTDVSPNQKQIDEAKDLIAQAVSRKTLDPSYIIIGKSTKYTPKYLFLKMSEFPQWKSDLSDV